MTPESEIVVEEKISGPISDWLSKNGFENIPLKEDHLGVEVIKILPNNLLSIVEALKNDGFKFIGPTIVDSFLMSSGFINGHEPKCYKYSKI